MGIYYDLSYVYDGDDPGDGTTNNPFGFERAIGDFSQGGDVTLYLRGSGQVVNPGSYKIGKNIEPWNENHVGGINAPWCIDYGNHTVTSFSGCSVSGGIVLVGDLNGIDLNEGSYYSMYFRTSRLQVYSSPQIPTNFYGCTIFIPSNVTFFNLVFPPDVNDARSDILFQDCILQSHVLSFVSDFDSEVISGYVTLRNCVLEASGIEDLTYYGTQNIINENTLSGWSWTNRPPIDYQNPTILSYPDMSGTNQEYLDYRTILSGVDPSIIAGTSPYTNYSTDLWHNPRYTIGAVYNVLIGEPISPPVVRISSNVINPPLFSYPTDLASSAVIENNYSAVALKVSNTSFTKSYSNLIKQGGLWIY